MAIVKWWNSSILMLAALDEFLDDIRKISKGNMDGVSVWTYGSRLCDGENLESGMGINTVLGIVGVVLPLAGCRCVGTGTRDFL